MFRDTAASIAIAEVTRLARLAAQHLEETLAKRGHLKLRTPIRGFVDSWIRGFVDSSIRRFVDAQ